MGFFDKLFGKNKNDGNDGSIPVVNDPMNEDSFWKIVETARISWPDKEEVEKSLTSQLKYLSAIEIIQFKLRLETLLSAIYTSEMWCAAYIINGGCSDDGFEYFRCWVVARGRTVYYQSKSNPDSLIAELSDEEEDYEFEELLYVADSSFEEKTEKDLESYISDEFIDSLQKDKEIELTWEEDNPESLRAICPNLFNAKWN